MTTTWNEIAVLVPLVYLAGVGSGLVWLSWLDRKYHVEQRIDRLNLEGYPECLECGEVFLDPVLLTMHVAAKHTPKTTITIPPAVYRDASTQDPRIEKPKRPA